MTTKHTRLLFIAGACALLGACGSPGSGPGDPPAPDASPDAGLDAGSDPDPDAPVELSLSDCTEVADPYALPPPTVARVIISPGLFTVDVTLEPSYHIVLANARAALPAVLGCAADVPGGATTARIVRDGRELARVEIQLPAGQTTVLVPYGDPEAPSLLLDPVDFTPTPRGRYRFITVDLATDTRGHPVRLHGFEAQPPGGNSAILADAIRYEQRVVAEVPAPKFVVIDRERDGIEGDPVQQLFYTDECLELHYYLACTLASCPRGDGAIAPSGSSIPFRGGCSDP